MNFLNQFWSLIVVPSEIKSGPGDEFESLESHEVDFYVLGKKSIFQWKRGYLPRLKIYVPKSQFFIILRIGYYFLIIFR